MSLLFVHFSISGKTLPVNEMLNKIKVDAKVYRSNEVITTKWGRTLPPQKSNRWVYSLEAKSFENINSLIKRMYKDLLPYRNCLALYTRSYCSIVEVVVYSDFSSDNTLCANLTQESIGILNSLHSKFSISFHDF